MRGIRSKSGVKPGSPGQGRRADALARGISDGEAPRAAGLLASDLADTRTTFIAIDEGMAPDVSLTRAFTRLDTSVLLPSIKASGLNPARLDREYADGAAEDK
jgi:nitronate monooxygenase